MHIILGGTGQVGAAAARYLLARAEPVTIVTRDASHGESLRAVGAEIAVADIRDARSLHDVLARGRRALLLNPPANPAGDIDVEESAGVAAILQALEGAPLEKVVVVSTYGARPGSHCGDLTVLHALEQGALAQPIPAAINRGAYYMSNWLLSARQARETGRLVSFLPADMPLAMVSPDDLGEAAARRLLEPADDIAPWHVEGPRCYTPRDVADVLSGLWGRQIQVEEVPPGEWEACYRQAGFSAASAQSFAGMTGVVADGGIETPADPVRGPTGLESYLRAALSN
ncbi:NAD(P)H-binding protein [Breoghania sp. JC706]|uniref:NmrA family NAD(P)-binding protein n=1 Tax=Breoghania sp. JC706 TaxID=3117732 RepID=UPI003008D72C